MTPVVHETAPEKLAAFPFPDASAEVTPLPSSNSQYPESALVAFQQMPALHNPLSQTVPQLPQLLASLLGFT